MNKEGWSNFLFVCLGLSSHSRIFQHYLWRVANFDLCSALMAIEQWRFFSVPHLLWHGVSVYNGYLRSAVTLTTTSKRLVVEPEVLKCGTDQVVKMFLQPSLLLMSFLINSDEKIRNGGADYNKFSLFLFTCIDAYAYKAHETLKILSGSNFCTPIKQ